MDHAQQIFRIGSCGGDYVLQKGAMHAGFWLLLVGAVVRVCHGP